MVNWIKGKSEQYGAGFVISSFSYVNGLLVITAGLACYVLCVLFNMFGIQPAPPQYSGNPISWILYLLIVILQGWFVWSLFASYLLFPLGAAVSMIDLLKARKAGTQDLFNGAVAGLALAAIPISLWYIEAFSTQQLMTLAAPLLHPHFR